MYLTQFLLYPAFDKLACKKYILLGRFSDVEYIKHHKSVLPEGIKSKKKYYAVFSNGAPNHKYETGNFKLKFEEKINKTRKE